MAGDERRTQTGAKPKARPWVVRSLLMVRPGQGGVTGSAWLGIRLSTRPVKIGQGDHMISLQTLWRAVAAMFFLNGLLFGVWAARISFFKSEHALSVGTLGLLLLVLAGGAIVSFPLAGRLDGPNRSASAHPSACGVVLAGVCLIAAGAVTMVVHPGTIRFWRDAWGDGCRHEWAGGSG